MAAPSDPLGAAVMDHDYDLITIGAGSGGVRASRVAAGLGARAAVIEQGELGGTCVNVGCIPKKLLVYAAHFAEELAEARGYGWSVGEVRFDWPTLVRNKNAEIARLNGVYRSLLEQAGVEIIAGRARLLGPQRVAVGERQLTARHLLVATGGRPIVPDLPGVEHAITSDEVFFLEQQPQRILIVGGGYVAVEFAGIFHGLGSGVVQIYRGPLFLRGFDDDLRLALAEELRGKGIDLRFDTGLLALESAGGRIAARLTDGSSLEIDQVLLAIGRHPNTAGMGLEDAGVELAPDGATLTDDFCRTSAESVFAVGDVRQGALGLTPVAIHEGMAVARTLFGGVPTKPDLDCVPTAVFSQPPLATVGLTEAEARERYGEIDVYRTRFRALKHTMTASTERTLVKLVVDRRSQRVLGAHMMGVEAPEILQGVAIAVKMGATKAQFDATVGIHPTAAEEFVTLRTPTVDS